MSEENGPTVVLFDAVGTVIKPAPDVVSVYERMGQEYGSRLSTSELKQRINQARQKYFAVRPASESTVEAFESGSGDFISSDEIELKLWRQLVVDVFRELADADKLFEELWEHFRLPEHWRIYDDAASCWEALKKQNCLIGLASNFDSRLVQLCESIPLLGNADFVFQSAGVGYRKPSQEFYRTVERELQDSIADPDSRDLTIYMVGDDLTNDCLGPNLAGWSGFWLNRSKQPLKLQAPTDFNQVSSLTEFAQRVLAIET